MPIHVTILYIVCIFLLSTIGVFVIRKNPKSPTHLSVFLFSLSVIFWMGSLYLGYFLAVPSTKELALLFTRLTFGFGIFMPFFAAMFFYYFPKKNKNHPFLETMFLVINIFVACFSSFTPYVYEAQVYVDNLLIKDKIGNYYFVFVFFFFLNFLILLYLSIKKTINSQGIDRKRVTLVMIGSSIFVFFAVLSHVILPFFGIYLFQAEVVAFSLAFSSAALYSIQKYRFLNFSSFSLNLFRQLIFFISFLFVAIVVHKMFDITGLIGEDGLKDILSYSVGIGMFLYLKKIFPEFISDSSRAINNALKDIRVKLYSCEEYHQLQKILENTFVLTLNITQVKIFVLREKDEGISIPVYIKDSFSDELTQFKNDVLVFEEIGLRDAGKEKSEELKKAMKSIDAELCFPLFSEEKLIGLFVLGEKENNELYTKEEIDELLKVVDSIAIVFMNILLKKNLQEENDLMKTIIKEKTDELRKQYEEMKKLVKQQSDFIAITSHEFRTPLTIAMFQLEDTLESHKHPHGVLSSWKKSCRHFTLSKISQKNFLVFSNLILIRCKSFLSRYVFMILLRQFIKNFPRS